ncbi:hypothetical protein EOM86_10995 [Candidatus Nomurabacteria bacterium]|nr:hypothetical protein [Candidatus Nomurabacteria bacterium]
MKDKSERDVILAELDSMKAPLPMNPDKVGLASLFELASVLFAYRERVSSILRSAIDDVNEIQKSQIMAKEQLRVKSTEILNRDEIKILKPIAVQQAACEVHLTPYSKAVMDSELTLSDARSFQIKVQMAHEALKDKMRTLRLQADICSQLMGFGPLPAGTDPLGRTKGAELV